MTKAVSILYSTLGIFTCLFLQPSRHWRSVSVWPSDHLVSLILDVWNETRQVESCLAWFETRREQHNLISLDLKRDKTSSISSRCLKRDEISPISRRFSQDLTVLTGWFIDLKWSWTVSKFKRSRSHFNKTRRDQSRRSWPKNVRPPMPAAKGEQNSVKRAKGGENISPSRSKGTVYSFGLILLRILPT